MASKQQDLWRDILNSQYWNGTLNDWEGANAAALYQQQNQDRDKWLSSQSQEIQDILSKPVASTSYYKNAGVDLPSATQNLIGQLTSLQGQGLDYGNKAMGADKQIQSLAADLARYGVADLNDLQGFTLTNPTQKNRSQELFYNSKTGAIIPTDFGSNMGGEGGTYYSLKNVNGKAIPVGSWTDTSEAGDFLPALSILTMPLTAGLTSALAPAVGTATGLGAAGATALTGAGIQGLTSGALSAAAGGDFGKGFLTGAVGSGIGSGISALNPAGMLGIASPTLAGAVNKGLSGGLGGLAGAAINGRDTGQGALSGLISGAISGGVSSGLKDLLGGDSTAGMLANFAGSQLGKYGSNALTGGQTPGPLSRATTGTVTDSSSNPAPRQLDLSRLPQQAQDRVRKAYGALSQYGANLGVKV